MTVAEEVWNLINTDIAVQRDLERNLINTRALARFLIKKYGISASMDAVISSIRRYKREKNTGSYEKKLLNIFKDSKITTRNNVACLTLKREALALIHKAITKNVYIVTGSKKIKLVCDQDELDSMLHLFSGHVVRTEENLGELSISIDEKASKTRGVAARISNEIALHKINIEELLICQPEFLVYVKQKDVIKTHESLLKLSNSK